MAQSNGASPIPYQVREAMRAGARGVQINRAVIERGQAGGHGGKIPGGGMKAFGGGEGGGAPLRGGSAGAGDPALTGDYDRGRIATIFGIPTANEGALTSLGKQQQADHDAIQGGAKAYAAALQGGATSVEAMRAAVKSGGTNFLTALMAHPTALQNMQNLGQVLSQSAGPLYGQVTAGGQQIAYDPSSGKALSAETVPGFAAQPKSGDWQIMQTDKGLMRVNKVSGEAEPVTAGGDAGGILAPQTLNKVGAGGAKSNGYTASDIGAGPQAPDARPDGKPPISSPVDMRFIRAIPGVSQALDTIQKLAPQVAGLGRSTVSIAAGNYLGTNSAGQQMSQAFKQINALAPDLAQRGAKVPTANWEALAGSPAQAPSALTAYAQQFKSVLRTTGQQAADDVTQRMGARFPLTSAQALMKAGIFPNGYQTSQYTMHNPDPTINEQGAWWQARNFPQGMTDDQRNQVIQQATATGKTKAARQQALGDDYNVVAGIATGLQQGARAQSQQTASSAAAASAQERQTPPPAGTNQQPVPGTAQSPAGASAAPAATTPAGPPASPTPAPAQQGAAGTGTPGNPASDYTAETAQQPGTGVPAPLPSAATAPGSIVPGTPTSQGITPPAPAPLSQTTLPGGAPPNPSTAATVTQQTQAAAATQQTQAAAGAAALPLVQAAQAAAASAQPAADSAEANQPGTSEGE
jgi:hypothetical protein